MRVRGHRRLLGITVYFCQASAKVGMPFEVVDIERGFADGRSPAVAACRAAPPGRTSGAFIFVRVALLGFAVVAR